MWFHDTTCGRQRTRRGHRVSLEIALGEPIKPKFQALHQCDTPPCVNPLHLYGGLPKANMEDQRARGRNFYAARTHCKHGHEYTEANTRWRADGKGRQCRICDSTDAKKYKVSA